MENQNQMPGMPGAESNFQAPLMESQMPGAESNVQEPQAPEVKEVLIPKAGIEVVALRKGFYDQKRIKIGQKFKVAKIESLGTWMECVDPEMEKKRLEFLKDKKARN